MGRTEQNAVLVQAQPGDRSSGHRIAERPPFTGQGICGALHGLNGRWIDPSVEDWTRDLRRGDSDRVRPTVGPWIAVVRCGEVERTVPVAEAPAPARLNGDVLGVGRAELHTILE